jgi:hypothetical protein
MYSDPKGLEVEGASSIAFVVVNVAMDWRHWITALRATRQGEHRRRVIHHEPGSG